VKTCEEFQELVSAYVDGELGDGETAEMFFHLGSCRECRTFMTSVMQLQSFLHVNEPPAAHTAPASKPPIWKRTFGISFPAAAAVVLTILSGTLFIVREANGPATVDSTQTEYVYVTSLPEVNIIASPLPEKKSN